MNTYMIKIYYKKLLSLKMEFILQILNYKIEQYIYIYMKTRNKNIDYLLTNYKF